MEMTFKKFLENKNISEAEYKEKDASETAKLYNEYNDGRFKAINEIVENIDKGDTKAIKKELEEAISLVQKSVDNNGLEIEAMKTSGKKGGEEVKSLYETVKDNADALKTVYGEHKVVEFAVKAAVLAGNAVTDSTISARDTNIGALASRKLTMYNLFRKQTLPKDHGGKITYIDWDTATTNRAADMVAEGAVFPESTARWQEYFTVLRKVGDSIPVSEEMLVDFASFAAELDSFLGVNVDLKIDDQLLNGDGTGQNLIGLDASAPTYTPVASGIQDASFYDLVPTVVADIVFGKGSKFRPNVVLMNLREINKYKLKKDNNDNYLMPPFVNDAGNVIDGLTVIENNNIADNVAYIGDSSMGRIYEGAEGYSLTVGEIDNQFTTDMKTLKARKRLLLLIKESEKAGWRKISSISAALTTIGS